MNHFLKYLFCNISLVLLFLFGLRSDTTLTVGEQTMTLGVWIPAPTPQPEIYHNDLVHPCVRYIEGGFAGSSWWLVATPYYKSNSATENPILFKGEGGEQRTPPHKWQSTAIVEEKPNPHYAYNSDPNLYYDGRKLWVINRPAYADYSSPYDFSVFACSTTDGKNFSKRKLLISNSSDSLYNGKSDNVMSPTVIERNGKLYIYAVHYVYLPERKFVALSIWENHGVGMDDCDFRFSKYVYPSVPEGFYIWHIDLLQYNDTLYCVAVSEIATQILLGQSVDGENFEFHRIPLISKKGCGATYTYKATAQIVDGVFYLWYPKKSRFDRIRYIYQSAMPWSKLRSLY